ncbi:MAG: hypothetical protein IJ629_05875 [Clostridia bacterium]|nr:hypothetical protein [Clostridia bacterium]
MIKTIILIILWLLIIPSLMGLYMIKFAKDDNKNILMAYIVGILIEFLVFEILAIPFTFLKFSFTALRIAWTVMITILTIISIILNRKNFKEILKVNIGKVKEMPKILTIIFLGLLIFQGYMGFSYMYEDYDDSNFVAKATIARDTDTLFVYNDIGYKYESFPTRHVFSPFPYYTATISEIVGTHPAITAHTVFPVAFLVVAYTVYYLIGTALFQHDRKKTMLFMVILSGLYIFGKYSRYAIFVRLLGRAWQGKSLLANIILPFIIYLFLEYLGEEKDGFYWVLLFITLWAADLLSSMSIFLPIIECTVLVVLYTIKDKNIKYILKFIPCCLPSIVYGIMYLIIK